MKLKKFQFKSDKYRKKRGGHSRFLHIFCESCEKPILLYQKDGPGQLKRMYLDRIHFPFINYKKGNFGCMHCNKVLGIFYHYKKESRPESKRSVLLLIERSKSNRK